MLEIIKVIVNINDNSQDPLINALISSYTQQVLNMTNLDVLPVELYPVIQDLVIQRYNKLGSEGMKQENRGAVAQYFSDEEFTSAIKKQIAKFKKVRVL